MLGVAGLCLFFFLRGRKQGLAARDAPATSAGGSGGEGQGTSGAAGAQEHSNELYGSSDIKEKPVELHGQSPPQELGPGVTRYEMGGGGHGWHGNHRFELP